MIPSLLTVGPHTVTIDASPATAQLLRDEHANGDSRPDHLLIRIDVERPHTCVADTLLHETMHTIWSRLTSLSPDVDD